MTVGTQLKLCKSCLSWCKISSTTSFFLRLALTGPFHHHCLHLLIFQIGIDGAQGFLHAHPLLDIKDSIAIDVDHCVLRIQVYCQQGVVQEDLFNLKRVAGLLVRYPIGY